MAIKKTAFYFMTAVLYMAQSKIFQKDASLTGRKLKAASLQNTKLSSVEECAVVCDRIQMCHSLSFNTNLNECMMYTKQTSKESNNGPGWVFYATKEELPKGCNSGGYLLEDAHNICFKVHEENRTYEQAKATCKTEGARLIVLDTNDKFLAINVKIRSLYPGMIGYLLGLDDINKEGEWKWSNGEPKGDYPIFNKDQPNDNDRRHKGKGADCAYASVVRHTMHKKIDRIYDDYCDHPASFVCERLDFM